eukprot:3419830-Pyramimonas_sp.AAC.2
MVYTIGTTISRVSVQSVDVSRLFDIGGFQVRAPFTRKKAPRPPFADWKVEARLLLKRKEL